MNDQKCGNCANWYRGEAGDTGLCREGPGQVVFVGYKPSLITQQPEPQVMTVVPTKHEKAWCGRWKPQLH